RGAAGCGGCEGSAESLPLLTRLEAKVAGAGLNLTRATLDATIKYPWAAPQRQAAAEPPKFGFYADDAAAYRWIKQEAPDGQLCLEAQVMDWADDVAYSVHDLEDGLHAGHITVGALHGAAERAAVVELARTRYLPPAARSRRTGRSARWSGASARARSGPRSPRRTAGGRSPGTPPAWWCHAGSGWSAPCSRR